MSPNASTSSFGVRAAKKIKNKKRKKQTTGVSNPVRSRDFFVVGKVAGSNGIRYLSSRGVFFCSHSLYMRKVQKISRPTMRPRESIALIFIDFP